MTSYAADAGIAQKAGDRPARRRREPTRLTLRAKALMAVAALFVYLGAATVIVEQQRAQLAGTTEEIERAHGDEERLGAAGAALAQAIIATDERYYRADAGRRLDEVVLAALIAHQRIVALAGRFPPLAPVNAELEAEAVRLAGSRQPEQLLELRQILHRGALAMDQASLEVRELRSRLNGSYRTGYDQVSMTWIGLGVVGMAVFGAVLLLFLTRLGWDLKRLHERALAVAKGYRGPALAVTRGDEIGALMRAVNRMQQDLVEREAQVEIARQQQFHREKMAAVGGLAGQIAHEINNPVAAIAGFAEAMCEAKQRSGCAGRCSPPHDPGCQPELIVAQARRVAAITRQISEFSSPQPSEPQLLDLNAVVESTCAFARYDARLRALQLDLDLDRQIPAVHAVGDHLTQVLMNLLMNAADAICDAGVPGRLRVATRRADGAVLLVVCDNGSGMDGAVQARAFEEFFTTKPKGRGCGIGLALSRRLLREVGGHIELASQPGQGTVVTVRLPVAPGAAR